MQTLSLGTGTMNGEILLKSKYATGPLAVFGTTYGYGSFYIGYGVESKGGFEAYRSTTPIAIRHLVLEIGGKSGLRIGVASKDSAIPIGDPVELTFHELV